MLFTAFIFFIFQNLTLDDDKCTLLFSSFFFFFLSFMLSDLVFMLVVNALDRRTHDVVFIPWIYNSILMPFVPLSLAIAKSNMATSPL